MPPYPELSATVLICTYNRAARLAETLASLGTTRTSRVWDVLVIDNNSSDATRAVVEAAAAHASVPVTWMFEQRQGKSYALNTGLAVARGDVVVFTDDDVRVGPGWLDAACGPLERDQRVDYTGGPVRPLWESEPPAWVDRARGDLWGTLAILDYGPDSFIFEERQRVPLGANMAVRRSLFARIGGFDPELGRRGHSLLGQEQAEFFARARAVGVQGRYVPDMDVQHHVPTVRLTKRYFRRWWYWKGVARARVDARHARTELGLDLRTVPRVAGVPRYVLGTFPRATARWLRASAVRDRHAAVRAEMECAYSLGYLRACWGRGSATASATASPEVTVGAGR